MYRSVKFGFDDATYLGAQRRFVEWSEEFATNAHMLVAGKSGTGKTYTLRRIVSQLTQAIPSREPARVYVFDVHGDMKFANESRVLFSESTHFGINPLRLSADPHFGGVRKCVQNFIDMMNDSSPRAQLGPRQVTTLRNILYEIFELRGFKLNEPSTWPTKSDTSTDTDISNGRIYLDIPYDERELAKSAARADGIVLQFDTEQRCWWCSRHNGGLERWPTRERGRKVPTVPDTARFIDHRLKSMVVGAGTSTIRLLEEHQKKIVARQKKLQKLQKDGCVDDLETLKEELNQDAVKIIESFSDYVLSIETGEELEVLARYESAETLRALSDRLGTLAAAGIFKPRKPPFDASLPVWVSDIAPLRESEQQFFVWTMLQQILDDAMECGPVSGASEANVVIVLDEAHKFFSDKESNILDKIVKEGRKFGVSLICASQAPSHFSEDFLSNVSTKVLLGLDPMYREQTIRKMRLDGHILDYLVAGKIAAVQVSDKRDSSHHFIKTRVGN